MKHVACLFSGFVWQIQSWDGNKNSAGWVQVERTCGAVWVTSLWSGSRQYFSNSCRRRACLKFAGWATKNFNVPRTLTPHTCQDIWRSAFIYSMAFSWNYRYGAGYIIIQVTLLHRWNKQGIDRKFLHNYVSSLYMYKIGIWVTSLYQSDWVESICK